MFITASEEKITSNISNTQVFLYVRVSKQEKPQLKKPPVLFLDEK